MFKKSKTNNIFLTKDIFIEKIAKENKIKSYLFNFIITFGSIGFLIIGINSFFVSKVNFLKTNDILFFPQGIIMCFYGILGLILSLNQILILYLKIGEGFNEFDKKKKLFKIFRKRFPNKKSDINIIYPLKDILRLENI